MSIVIRLETGEEPRRFFDPEQKKTIRSSAIPARCSRNDPRDRPDDLLSRCRVNHLRQHEAGGGDEDRPEAHIAQRHQRINLRNDAMQFRELGEGEIIEE
jgi:hypothetical protein